MARLLILTALTIEARAVRRATSRAVWPVGISVSRLNAIPRVMAGDVVLLCGLAGALNPGLNIGDVLLDDPDHLTPAGMPLPRRRVFTVDQLVTTSEEKAELFARTGCDGVDMEQGILRRWCQSQQARLISLRTISDTARHAVDPAVLALVDDLGNPRWAPLARLLLRRPGVVQNLLQLQTHSKLALQALQAAVGLLLKSIEEAGTIGPE